MGVVLMLTLSMLTSIDVALRAWAQSPIAGFNELVEQLMGVAIVACFPAALAGNKHLTLDIISKFITVARARWFRNFGAAALLLSIIILAWQVALESEAIAGRDETTWIMAFPRGPVMWTITVLLAISVVVQAVALLVPLVPTGGAESKLGGWNGPLVFALMLAAALVTFTYFGIEFSDALQKKPVLLAAIMFAAMWAFSLSLVPLGAAMILSGLAGTAFILGPKSSLNLFGSEISDFLVRIDLAVLPLFVLMGSLAAAAGLSNDIYRFAQAILSRYRGGLALATIGGCAGFGAVTGSSIATVATMGSVALPEMRQRGYSIELAAGSVAAGGTLGILVPPSSAMILYALLTEVSIGKLFVAAILPAVVGVALYMATVSLIVHLKEGAAPAAEKSEMGEIVSAAKGSLAILILFAVVLGGIYGGIFTATEAAAVGAGGAFLIALLRGRLGGGRFLKVMSETAATTGMLYLLIIGGLTFSNFIALTELPDIMVAFIQSFDLAPLTVVAVLLVIYVMLGSVMEPFAIMLITVPITAPLVAGLGYDLVWWGIIMIVVIETGLMTPPVGMNVFVIKSIADDVPLARVFMGVAPFVGADVVRLAILTLFPAIVLWLPSTML
jgi:tripartite ATP-independent transporter DctM subunit